MLDTPLEAEQRKPETGCAHAEMNANRRRSPVTLASERNLVKGVSHPSSDCEGREMKGDTPISSAALAMQREESL